MRALTQLQAMDPDDTWQDRCEYAQHRRRRNAVAAERVSDSLARKVFELKSDISWEEDPFVRQPS